MGEFILQILAVVVLLGHILIGLVLVAATAGWLTGRPSEQVVPQFLWRWLRRYGLHLSFLVTMGATGGSLYFSELAGLAPCLFCWYQRIFMYPLVVILAVAMLTEDRRVSRYVLPLSAIGGLLAAYHYYLQKINPAAAECFVGDVSCADITLEYFGYITIPMMSLTAFVLVAWMVYYVGNGNLDHSDDVQST